MDKTNACDIIDLAYFSKNFQALTQFRNNTFSSMVSSISKVWLSLKAAFMHVIYNITIIKISSNWDLLTRTK